MNPEEPMTAMPYSAMPEDYEDEDLSLPGRPRRQFWTRGTAALLAVLLGAIGFFAGVRVEKSQVSNAAPTTGSSGTGARAAAAARGFGGGAGGFAARLGGGNGTFGTVSTVNGNTLYVTDATGNTVKVTFNPATKVTKSVSVSKSAIRPGDTVVIQGLKRASGNIAATSVNDSGARGGSLGGGGGSSSRGGSGSNSAGSAVNSLFGAG